MIIKTSKQLRVRWAGGFGLGICFLSAAEVGVELSKSAAGFAGWFHQAGSGRSVSDVVPNAASIQIFIGRVLHSSTICIWFILEYLYIYIYIRSVCTPALSSWWVVTLLSRSFHLSSCSAAAVGANSSASACKSPVNSWVWDWGSVCTALWITELEGTLKGHLLHPPLQAAGMPPTAAGCSHLALAVMVILVFSQVLTTHKMICFV